MNIKFIYISIISLKYFKDDPVPDYGKIRDLIGSISYLSRDYNVIFDSYYDIYELCMESYTELLNSSYGELMNPEMEEEFMPEHLLDIEYHLKNFKKWWNADKRLSKIIELEIWRYI